MFLRAKIRRILQKALKFKIFSRPENFLQKVCKAGAAKNHRILAAPAFSGPEARLAEECTWRRPSGFDIIRCLVLFHAGAGGAGAGG
jgi:hypothetical protein